MRRSFKKAAGVTKCTSFIRAKYLSIKQAQAREVTLVVLGPGDLFGETALVENTKRSVTAVAAEDNTQLVVLDRANFLFMVQQRPQFALSVIRTLCQNLRDPSRSGNCRK